MDKKWRHLRILFFALCLLTRAPFNGFSLNASDLMPASKETLSSKNVPSKHESNAGVNFLKSPLYFEHNKGQTDSSVHFLVRGQGFIFYFTPQEIVGGLNKQTEENNNYASLKIIFVDANPFPILKGQDKQESKSHYFIGSNPQKWQSNVSHYARVVYESVYPGIDVVFYGNQRHLEYDICLQPGSDPKQVRFKIEGAQKLSLDKEGNLQIAISEEENLLIRKPLIYQMIKEEKVLIDGHFDLLANCEIGFSLGTYNQNYSLIIDPILDYSTYLGGSGIDFAKGIVVDSEGNAYITGLTQSADFPVTAGAFQTTFSGGPSGDAYVAKLNSSGTALIYSTYLGGDKFDAGSAIAVDREGNAYITGETGSTNFPVTPGAFQTSLNGFFSAFVTKLNSSGAALIYSTYLGGSDFQTGRGIAIDQKGYAYVIGDTDSTDFPVTPGVFQTALAGEQNAFVTKINQTGSGFVYSTYLGGGNIEYGNGISVDRKGYAYVVGLTLSTDFPVTPGAFQTALAGRNNGFVTKLNPEGTGLVYSTYLGGSKGDNISDISIDRKGYAYVVGITGASDFPVTPGAFQTTLGGESNAFVTKLNPEGTGLVYSTYLGGKSQDGGSGIAIDKDGHAYITGNTTSTNFPVTPGAFQTTYQGRSDAFVTKLDPTGSTLAYSTYLGGNRFDGGLDIALDTNFNAYITGPTNSPNFPVTPGAFQPALDALQRGYVTKFNIGTLVFPPSKVKGCQKAKRSKECQSKFNYTNIITWEAPNPNEGLPPVSYRIYRDRSLTKLIAEIPADAELKFKDANRKKGKVYTYCIVSVSATGNVSASNCTTITSCDKCGK